MEKKIVLVVAPTVQRFISFVETLDGIQRVNRSSARAETEDTEFIFVNDPDRMKGFHQVEVLFLSGWSSLPKAEEIHKQGRWVLR